MASELDNPMHRFDSEGIRSLVMHLYTVIDQIETGKGDYPIRGYRIPLLTASGNMYQIALTRTTPAEMDALREKCERELSEAEGTQLTMGVGPSCFMPACTAETVLRITWRSSGSGLIEEHSTCQEHREKLRAIAARRVKTPIERELNTAAHQGERPVLGFCESALSQITGIQEPHVKSPECIGWYPEMKVFQTKYSGVPASGISTNFFGDPDKDSLNAEVDLAQARYHGKTIKCGVGHTVDAEETWFALQTLPNADKLTLQCNCRVARTSIERKLASL